MSSEREKVSTASAVCDLKTLKSVFSHSPDVFVFFAVSLFFWGGGSLTACTLAVQHLTFNFSVVALIWTSLCCTTGNET